MPLQAIEINNHPGLEFDPYDIDIAAVRRGWSAGFHQCDVRVLMNDGFRVQKAGGKFGVIPGRTHRDRDVVFRSTIGRLVAEPNLQGLFDGNPIVPRPPRGAIRPARPARALSRCRAV